MKGKKHKGKVVTVVTERRLGEFEFQCDKCGAVHKKSAYAIAQQAMRVPLIFTCECGNKISL